MRESACAVMEEPAKTYSMTGGPKGLPLLGVLLEAMGNPLELMMGNAVKYGDIIPFATPDMKAIQLNHPDLVRQVLVENHKNYYKSKAYIRFQSAVGEGLITSNGEKWRRDRQKIQPLFKREQIEGYYFDVVNSVSEKCKRRWLAMTKGGKAEININSEMAAITMEVILRTLFGKDNITDADIAALYKSFEVVLEYLRNLRLLPKVDFRRMFRTPKSQRYQEALGHIHSVIKTLSEQYLRDELSDRQNMLALLLEAQKQDPENFTDQDIIDHAVTMIFGGFETTANSLLWMWYVLDSRPEVVKKLCDEVAGVAPATITNDSAYFTFDDMANMTYLDAVFKETLRFYPAFWITSREPVQPDTFGSYRVEKGTVVVLPQIVLQRHPRFWDEPNAFIPERFSPENEGNIDPGLYFPFSQGPRKCIGYRFAEMEAKSVIAKLAPLFRVKVLNSVGNDLDLGISLKLKHPLIAEIQRV